MTAINSLFGKMQPFVTHENVVFMFDPKNYPAVSVGCTPSIENIIGLPEDETAPGGMTISDNVNVTYSYNGGLARTVTFSGSSPKDTMLMDMALSINTDAGVDLIHFDGLPGAAPFAILGVDGAYDRLSGGNGSASAAPADLVLSLTPSDDYDAVAILFGSAVTIHSCGPQTWEAT